MQRTLHSDGRQQMSRLQRYLSAMAERYGRAPRRLTEYQRDLDAAMMRHPAGKQRQVSDIDRREADR